MLLPESEFPVTDHYLHLLDLCMEVAIARFNAYVDSLESLPESGDLVKLFRVQITDARALRRRLGMAKHITVGPIDLSTSTDEPQARGETPA